MHACFKADTAHEGLGTAYYSFPSLDAVPFVRHGFSTRLGGVSEGVFSSMNLSFTRGDRPEAVMENFGIFCRNLGVRAEDVVISAQEHHTNLYNVTAADRGPRRDTGTRLYRHRRPDNRRAGRGAVYAVCGLCPVVFCRSGP